MRDREDQISLQRAEGIVADADVQIDAGEEPQATAIDLAADGAAFGSFGIITFPEYVDFVPIKDLPPSPESDSAVPPARARFPRDPDRIFQDRELMGVLMADEWSGLRLIETLRDATQGLKASLLARRLGWHVDACTLLIARLFRFGALEIEDHRFVVSGRGQFILARIDELICQPEAIEEVCLETAR